MQKKHALVAIAAITAITAISMYALYLGMNGGIYELAVIAIGAAAGFSVTRPTQKPP